MNSRWFTACREQLRGIRFVMLAGVVAAALALPALAEEPLKISRSAAMSAATAKPAPSYPPMAKQLRVEGEVEVKVVINEDGAVDEAATVSGNPILATAALDAAKQWKFTPFKSDAGKATKVQTTLSFAFKM